MHNKSLCITNSKYNGASWKKRNLFISYEPKTTIKTLKGINKTNFKITSMKKPLNLRFKIKAEVTFPEKRSYSLTFSQVYN